MRRLRLKDHVGKRYTSGAFKLTLAILATGLAGTAIFASAHADANVYYVSPTGSDTNDGSSQATAFQTIQKALDVATPGTTINLAAGVYSQPKAIITKTAGTATEPITIQGPETGKDISGRYQVVMTNTDPGGSHVLDIDHSYYKLRGFTIDGQSLIDHAEYPSDFTQTRAFKDSVQSRVVDSRLIYIGASASSHDITGVSIDDMWLQGAGGECVRLRNRATDNTITNSTIRWCGMYTKGNDVDQYKYHNAEGVYIGTSPKSTTQPMYANDASTGNVVSNSTIETYGSECFNIKENAHDNTMRGSICRYNDEPASFEGSNVEFRGDHNTLSDNAISDSRGVNIKLMTDSATYDTGGNTARNNTISNSAAAAIKSKMSASLMGEFCQNTFANNIGGQQTIANSVGDPTRTCSATDTQAPTVSVVSPTNNTNIGTQNSVSIDTSVSDNNAVSRVEFLINDIPMITDMTAPFSYSLTTPSTPSLQRIVARAYDSYGNVGLSQPVILNVTPPSTPTNLSATATSNTSVQLSWNASSPVVAASYDVYRNGTKVATTTSSSYSNTGLAENTTYSYYVKALDSAGNQSDASTTVTVTTPMVTNIAFEAESGVLSSPMVSATSTSAQGGRFIRQPSGTTTGKATYTFNVNKPGTYKMSWRAWATGTASDTFYYAFDGAANTLKTLPVTTGWQWTNITTTSVNLTAGTHKLVISRAENNTALDAINLTLDVPTPVYTATQPFEAEAGSLTSGMTVTADTTASSGKYIKATASTGTATYTVQVPTAGTYMIGGYIKAANTSSDSFNIKADNGAYQTWNLTSPSNTWTYDATSNPSFSLSAGIHTITVQYREANAALDRLVLNKL